MSIEGSRVKGLGRGLSALLNEARGQEEPVVRPRPGVREVALDLLDPGRYQPRRNFAPEELEALVGSIREKGVLQPILVRRQDHAPGRYEIVAGERRFRAAQAAGLHQVPVVVREFTDLETLEVALVENLQRQDLSAIEEALAYRRLAQEFGHSQEQLAQAVGKSRSHIANLLRLLTLPESVQSLIDRGDLSAGHARALIGTADPEGLARRILAQALNVRQAEKLAALEREKKPRQKVEKSASDPASDPDRAALEDRLGLALGLAVRLVPAPGQGAEAGELRIEFRTLDQFDELCRRLLADPPAGPAEDPL